MSPKRTSHPWLEHKDERNHNQADQRRSAGLSLIYEIQQENVVNAAALHWLPSPSFSQHMSINFNSLLNAENKPRREHPSRSRQCITVLPIDHEQRCLGLLFIRHNPRFNITQLPLLQPTNLSLFALNMQAINDHTFPISTEHQKPSPKVSAYLSKSAFYTALYYVLKHYHESNLLQTSPLLVCPLVTRSSRVLQKSPLTVLREKIDHHIQAMLSVDNTASWGLLIKQCYIEKNVCQEQLAERLNKSASTVRRYLRQAKEQLAAELYQEEILARAKQKAEPPK